MKEEVVKKYIEGNTTMQLAEILGNDLFETYLIDKIDSMDELLAKEPTNEIAKLAKQIFEQVREAYYNLKK